MLDDAARRAPDRAFLVERDARRRWRQIGFATAAKRSRRSPPRCVRSGASETRPVMILSGNGIDHALLTLGAAHAAIPVAPIAAALGLDARDDFARLPRDRRRRATGGRLRARRRHLRRRGFAPPRPRPHSSASARRRPAFARSTTLDCSRTRPCPTVTSSSTARPSRS